MVYEIHKPQALRSFVYQTYVVPYRFPKDGERPQSHLDHHLTQMERERYYQASIASKQRCVDQWGDRIRHNNRAAIWLEIAPLLWEHSSRPMNDRDSAISKLKRMGYTCRAIGEIYNLSNQRISQIVEGRHLSERAKIVLKLYGPYIEWLKLRGEEPKRVPFKAPPTARHLANRDTMLARWKAKQDSTS